MTNNIWSKKLQGILTLDLSREIRFRDDQKDAIIEMLRLKPEMTIADIGCGPGAITRKLASWLGAKTRIIGIDRDTNFINYAQAQAEKKSIKNICYLEGDALDLPLPDNSVDACLSYTVIEHIPNREFLLEQKRVCKNNGIVSVMLSRPDKYIKSEPANIPKITAGEIELWAKLNQGMMDINQKYNVGQYWPAEDELPSLYTSLGFENIRIDALAVPIAIDDARNSPEAKIRLIEIEKQQALERVEMLTGSATSTEKKELQMLIADRFATRLDLLKNNKKIWDYTVIIIQAVSGVVKK